MGYGQTQRNQMRDKMNIERRKRWLRRLFYDWKDDLGLFFWMIAAFGIGVVAWGLYGLFPR